MCSNTGMAHCGLGNTFRRIISFNLLGKWWLTYINVKGPAKHDSVVERIKSGDSRWSTAPILCRLSLSLLPGMCPLLIQCSSVQGSCHVLFCFFPLSLDINSARSRKIGRVTLKVSPGSLLGLSITKLNLQVSKLFFPWETAYFQVHRWLKSEHTDCNLMLDLRTVSY